MLKIICKAFSREILSDSVAHDSLCALTDADLNMDS